MRAGRSEGHDPWDREHERFLTLFLMTIEKNTSLRLMYIVIIVHTRCNT